MVWCWPSSSWPSQSSSCHRLLTFPILPAKVPSPTMSSLGTHEVSTPLGAYCSSALWACRSSTPDAELGRYRPWLAFKSAIRDRSRRQTPRLRQGVRSRLSMAGRNLTSTLGFSVERGRIWWRLTSGFAESERNTWPQSVVYSSACRQTLPKTETCRQPSVHRLSAGNCAELKRPLCDVRPFGETRQDVQSSY